MNNRNDTVDNLIMQWHNDETCDVTLYEYLNLTEEEYNHWVMTNELPLDYKPEFLFNRCKD
jgi:hypothetical protein